MIQSQHRQDITQSNPCTPINVDKALKLQWITNSLITIKGIRLKVTQNTTISQRYTNAMLQARDFNNSFDTIPQAKFMFSVALDFLISSCIGHEEQSG